MRQQGKLSQQKNPFDQLLWFSKRLRIACSGAQLFRGLVHSWKLASRSCTIYHSLGDYLQSVLKKISREGARGLIQPLCSQWDSTTLQVVPLNPKYWKNFLYKWG